MKKITIYIVFFNKKNTLKKDTKYNDQIKDVINTTLHVCEENYNSTEFIENYIIGFIYNKGFDPKKCGWIIKKEKENKIENTLNKSIFIEKYML